MSAIPWDDRPLEQLTRARFERKLVLDDAGALAFQLALAGRLFPRRFAGSDRTLVTSIYLDRPDGGLVRRVLRGAGAMTRVRVKLYQPAGAGAAGPPVDALALEIKRSRGGLTRKVRVWLPPAELKPLLLAPRRREARALHLGLLAPGASPICVVGYERIVFEAPDGKLRVTFDRRLGWAAAEPGLLDEVATGIPPAVQPAPDAPVVVEVKHTAALPRWLAALGDPPAKRFSKLCWAIGALASGAPARGG